MHHGISISARIYDRSTLYQYPDCTQWDGGMLPERLWEVLCFQQTTVHSNIIRSVAGMFRYDIFYRCYKRSHRDGASLLCIVRHVTEVLARSNTEDVRKSSCQLCLLHCLARALRSGVIYQDPNGAC